MPAFRLPAALLATAVAALALPAVVHAAAPAPPIMDATIPRDIGNKTAIKIRGTAAGADTVQIYATADCSGPIVATGTRGQFHKFGGISATVAPNSTTTFSATATAGGMTSGCSANTVTYTNDSIAPGRPILTGTTPVTPSTTTRPKVKGIAEAGSRVQIYDSANCSGAPIGAGLASRLVTGMAVGPLSVGMHQFSATAMDPAGNVSGCTLTPIVYTVLPI